MAFEDKMNQLKKSMDSNHQAQVEKAPRISKSYTLKQNVANELAKRAHEKDMTASRYLESLLKKEFNCG
ncbi:hypothetical protein [Fructobacillus fructosus]|uniref:Uncharacterized protein n=1 Tax=Fructobacillus fructosus TaxID=1631 RepID=A0ABN9YQU6_9LACO|nr:hypothetical protein [Fructobacillus fructosus]MBC9119420.1 hypothetical protein [Fructobacillus fructosus]MBD9367006.1 hypothetical protein [Leuconostoc mesenteroides]CAK1230107.1 unnamed protein product [Fructobacillus fructosus]